MTKEYIRYLEGQKQLDQKATLYDRLLQLTIKRYNGYDAESANKDYAQLLRNDNFSGIKNLIDGLNLDSVKTIPVELLPVSYFSISFTFTLKKPYISRDDEVFYLHENPVFKDKVFKVPMVSGSSWKGNLRWTATHLLIEQYGKLKMEEFAKRRFQLTRLFGDEKGEEPGDLKNVARFFEKEFHEAEADYRKLVKKHFKTAENDPLPHHAGHLHFYSTFLYNMRRDVITPLGREKRVPAHGAIPVECVPQKTPGRFKLLYVPFDLIGSDISALKQQVTSDLLVVVESIKEMMLTYGFSAKKSAGYGITESSVENGNLVTDISALQLVKPGKKDGIYSYEIKDLISFYDDIKKQ
jgi:CRISPR-associated protein Cmr2